MKGGGRGWAGGGGGAGHRGAQRRKRNRNESEEIEEITFPLNPYMLQGQQALPNVSQYQLDAHKIHNTFASPNHQIGSRDILLQTGYPDAKSDAKAEADTNANGIPTKNNVPLILLGGHNRPAMVSCLPCQTHNF